MPVVSLTHAGMGDLSIRRMGCAGYLSHSCVEWPAFFWSLFIFFVIELGSRQVGHFGVTRSPMDEWDCSTER